MSLTGTMKPRGKNIWLGGLSIWQLVTRTMHKTIRDDATTQAAAIAYYAFSALVPFLGVLITLAVGLLPDLALVEPDGHSTAGQTVARFQGTLRELLPAGAYQIVRDQIARIQKQPPVGLLSIGLAVSLYLASAVFQAVVAALNRIYGVVETRSIWKLYLLALAMTAVEAAILILGLLAIAVGEPILHWLGLNAMQAVLAIAAQWVSVILLVLLSFALIFFIAPNARQRWEWVTPGSLIGTLIFLIASLLFRLFTQYLSNYEKTYGALGGVIAMLFWLWLLGLALLVAAELNAVIRNADCAREPELCADSPTEAPLNDAPVAQSSLWKVGPSGRGPQEFAPMMTDSNPPTISGAMSAVPRRMTAVAREIMNQAPRTCSKFSTVTEAVLIFKDEDCSLVPVVEDGKPIGVVTDRDVALSLAEHPDLTDRPVAEIMTRDLVAVDAQAPVSLLARVMAQQQVRRLLIVDDAGLLVGVVAWSDVAPFLPLDQTGAMVSEVVEKTGESNS